MKRSPLILTLSVLSLLAGCSDKLEDSGDTQDTQSPTPGECAAGERVADNECVPCEAGSVNAAGDLEAGENTECDPCEAGSFAADGESCEPCEPGSTAEAQAESCEPCPEGSYELENECVDCPEDFTSEAGSTSCTLAAASGYLDIRDYGYLFWPGNHWVSWGSYFNVQHVQTGFYGMAFDVGTGSFDHFGLIADEHSATEALSSDNAVVTDLPTASIQYALVKNGNEHRGAQQFLGYDGSSTNPSGLIDMGRYMQRVEIPQVTYADSEGYSGAIQLAAMPRHFVLTHRVSSSSGAEDLTVSIEIEGDAIEQYTEREFIEGSRALSIADESGEGWTFVLPEGNGMSSEISEFGDGGLSFKTTFDSAAANQIMALTLTGVPSHAATEAYIEMILNPEEAVTVSYEQLNRDGSSGSVRSGAPWDAQRGAFVVSLGDMTNLGAPTWPDWNNESYHNWYNRHHVSIEHTLSEAVSVPIAFDGGNNTAFYITGGSPLLRSTEGEPLGVPVQISKNWHESPYWYHLYSTLIVEPGTFEFEHTFAHAKWGKTYAAQHAQLALIGWGQNQQWDESSLGAWGESITYDPDLTLTRGQVDDVRPFLVQSASKWNWTGNVGGASFLVYEPSEGFSSFASHQMTRMRTHYEYTGPNLTNVLYSGISRDGKIESTVATQLGRTDDMVRAYYHLSYTFLEDVNYDRIAFFQMAADRYGDNGFTRFAYGNEEKALYNEGVPNHSTSGYANELHRGIELEGDAPWVMLLDSVHTSGSLPEHYANVGFIVRDYHADIGGEITTTPHVNIVQTYNGGWSQMAFELGVPYDSSSTIIPAGSTLTATVEYVVPPAVKSAYYGASDYLTALDEDSFNSTDMMVLLAADNQLDLSASVGSITRTHPIEIDTVSDTIAAEFTMSGGLGYTPVTFHGLVRPDGWRLETLVDGNWEEVDQAIEGNDYWQAYEDAANGTFELTFNVHNRGENQYRLKR